MKSILTALVVLATTAGAEVPSPPDLAAQGRTLDTRLFDAYNACDLAAFGALLAADIELYHDKGGLMTGRQAVVDAVERNICGKVRREPIEGTLSTYPMDGYGMLQFGEHRFCTADTGTCTGTARFVHLWQQSEAGWQATRIFSYDHQPLQPVTDPAD